MEVQQVISNSVKRCGADKIVPGEAVDANVEFDDDDDIVYY